MIDDAEAASVLCDAIDELTSTVRNAAAALHLASNDLDDSGLTPREIIGRALSGVARTLERACDEAMGTIDKATGHAEKRVAA